MKITTLFFCLLYFALAQVLPESVHAFFYAVSLTIKETLIWIMPLMVFFFISSSIASFEKKAPLFLITLFVFEFLSNFSSTWYAYLLGFGYSSSIPLEGKDAFSKALEPLWKVPFVKPAFWSPDRGAFLAVIVGLFSALLIPKLAPFLKRGKEAAETVLTQCFSPLIPLFILGFLAKVYKTNLLIEMAYLIPSLLFLFLFLGLFILFLFFLGSKKQLFQHLRNILPATALSFTSGCSLSTMPWTIKGAEKNLKNPALAKLLIPITTNIQQVGDVVINCFLCFFLYTKNFGSPPSLSLWIPFSIVFTLARFGTAAVIGGAIFIMLPIYESYLHFTPEMLATILAFNVLLDPFVTSSNVTANAALAKIFEKWAFRPINAKIPSRK